MNERMIVMLQEIYKDRLDKCLGLNIRELGSFILASTSVVVFYLEKLEKLEYITRIRNRSRSIRITKEGINFLEDNLYV